LPFGVWTFHEPSQKSNCRCSGESQGPANADAAVKASSAAVMPGTEDLRVVDMSAVGLCGLTISHESPPRQLL
jgi:hypothetical protein